MSAGGVWRFGVELVSPTTREVLGQTVDVESMSVDWAYRAVDPTHSVEVADSTPRRTGQIRVRHVEGFNPLAVWYRPWIEQLLPAVQDDDDPLLAPYGLAPHGLLSSAGQVPAGWAWNRSRLGTFTASRMPGLTRDATTTMRVVPLAEVSVRWSEQRLTAPLSLAPGTNVIEWIAEDMQLRFGETDVSGLTPSSKVVAANATWDHDYIGFDAGVPLIDVYDRLLAYAGYEPLRVDKDPGRPIAHPARDFATEPATFMFGGSGAGISPQVEIAPITPDIPNEVVFQARNAPSLAEDGNGWRTVRNENSGPGSVQQRGRVISQTVTVDADSQEELDAIARYRAPLIFAGGGWTLSATAKATLDLDDSDVLDLTHTVGASGRWLCVGYGFSAAAGRESAIVDMGLQAELLAGAAFAADALAQPPAVATVGVAYRGVAA